MDVEAICQEEAWIGFKVLQSNVKWTLSLEATADHSISVNHLNRFTLLVLENKTRSTQSDSWAIKCGV